MATVTPTLSIAAKYGLPQFKENRDFDQWEHEIEVQKMVTDLPETKHGSVVFLSLSEKVRQQLKCITKEELAGNDGLTKIMEKLRELYAASKDQIMYLAYEKFEDFKRSDDMSILEYINEFDRLHLLLKNYKIDLPAVTLYYKLLQTTNSTTNWNSNTNSTSNSNQVVRHGAWRAQTLVLSTWRCEFRLGGGAKLMVLQLIHSGRLIA